MSYGNPSLKSAMDSLMAQGVTRLIVLPLYPQFSCSTVAAVWDGLSSVFAGYRSMPDVHFIRDYAEHPAYIAALKASVERSFAKNGKPDLLVLSFHGIPQRFANEGDDYPQRCRDTTDALTRALGLSENEVMMTFQSRFGREAFPPTVWRRWRRSTSKTENSSCTPVAKSLNIFRRSMTMKSISP